jgi:hypothetical protein
MTKKQTGAPETVSSDYVLMQVTLTVAMTTFFCTEHEGMADQRQYAEQELLETLSRSTGSEIVVLASDFKPLMLTADRS